MHKFSAIRRIAFFWIIFVVAWISFGTDVYSGKVLNFVTIESGATKAAYDKIFSLFEAQYPGVKVNVVSTTWDAYDAKVDLFLATGDPPAIWLPAAQRGYRYYATKGLLADLTPLISKDRYDVTDFHRIPYDFCHVSSRLMALPWYNSVQSLRYNKDLFDSSGLPPVTTNWEDNTWTWDAFLKVAQKLTKDTNGDGKIDQFGCVNIFERRFPVYAFGGDWFSEDDYKTGFPTKCIIDDPNSVRALQFFADLIWKYKVVGGQFETGKVGMTSGYGWEPQNLWNFTWGVGAIPRPASGVRQKVVLFPNQFVMFKDQRYPSEAWELLKFLLSEEAMKIYLEAKPSAIYSRKNLTPIWIDRQVKNWGLTRQELEAIVRGLDYAHVSTSHAIVPFADMFNSIFGPELDAIWSGRKDVDAAVKTMKARAEAYIKQMYETKAEK